MAHDNRMILGVTQEGKIHGNEVTITRGRGGRDLE